METTNTLIDDLEQQSSETVKQVQDEADKQNKIKVTVDDLKIPTANEAFKARVTCQRRS